MNSLGVYASLKETVLLKRTEAKAAAGDVRPPELPGFGRSANDADKARPRLPSFRRSLDEVRREKQLQEARRESVQRAKNALQRRQKNTLSELREDRRRESREDRIADTHHEFRAHESERSAEQHKNAVSQPDESRRDGAVADSKRRDDGRPASGTEHDAAKTSSPDDGRQVQTGREDVKSNTDGQAQPGGGQTAALTGQTALPGEETAEAKPPENGKPAPVAPAEAKNVQAEKSSPSDAGRQVTAEKSKEGGVQDQQADKNKAPKPRAVSQGAVKTVAPSKTQASGNTRVVPDDANAAAVGMAKNGAPGVEAASSAIAKNAPSQPVPAARAVPPTAADVQAGAKTGASVATQRLEPAGQSGTEKQGGHADLFGGGHSASATAQASGGADAAENVPRPFQQDLLQQIVDKAVLHLKAGKTELRINLKPEVLGHLRLHIASDQQQITLKIVTESTWVKTMVEHHIGQLRAELQNHNLHIDHLDVSVAGDFQPAAGGNPQAGSSGREALGTGVQSVASEAVHSETVPRPAQTAGSRERVGLIDYFV